MDIETSPRKILAILLVIIGFLLFANLMGIVSKFVFGHDWVYGLIDLFDFNTEENVPTLYSSLQLVFASLLLLVIGTKHRSEGYAYVPWLVLSILFLFLAVDETAQLHELLLRPVREKF